MAERARELAARSDRPDRGPGIALGPLNPKVTENQLAYSSVSLDIDRDRRVGTLTIRGPEGDQPTTPEAILAAGDQFWALRVFRELDDVLLRVRVNEPEIGTYVIKTVGDPAAVLKVDETLLAHKDHWLVREIILFMKRTLKRVDLTARTFFALIQPGSCFAGSLFELALAADRSYMFSDPDQATSIQVSRMSAGPLLMSNGLTRLQVRYLAAPDKVLEVLAHEGPFNPTDAEEIGLVTFAPDEIDWDDEVRLAIESRTSLSPDALTGLEANLRFAGPETMETKIFGRLTAWQNWIFQRPNAVGARGALTAYGAADIRPEFDWGRT